MIHSDTVQEKTLDYLFQVPVEEQYESFRDFEEDSVKKKNSVITFFSMILFGDKD